jgi:hypothetical protein
VLFLWYLILDDIRWVLLIWSMIDEFLWVVRSLVVACPANPSQPLGKRFLFLRRSAFYNPRSSPLLDDSNPSYFISNFLEVSLYFSIDIMISWFFLILALHLAITNAKVLSSNTPFHPDGKLIQPMNVYGQFPANPTYGIFSGYVDSTCESLSLVVSHILDTCISNGNTSLIVSCSKSKSFVFPIAFVLIYSFPQLLKVPHILPFLIRIVLLRMRSDRSIRIVLSILVAVLRLI